jgi:hypothetical protein
VANRTSLKANHIGGTVHDWSRWKFNTSPISLICGSAVGAVESTQGDDDVDPLSLAAMDEDPLSGGGGMAGSGVALPNAAVLPVGHTLACVWPEFLPRRNSFSIIVARRTLARCVNQRVYRPRFCVTKNMRMSLDTKYTCIGIRTSAVPACFTHISAHTLF